MQHSGNISVKVPFEVTAKQLLSIGKSYTLIELPLTTTIFCFPLLTITKLQGYYAFLAENINQELDRSLYLIK